MNKINDLLNLILNELKHYLTIQEYSHLEYIKNNVVIYHINDSINMIDIIDTNNTYISSIHVQPNSQIIDMVPLYDHHQIHHIKPILLIREDASTTQIIHEICHLFSIGSYEDYYHTLGVNEYHYDKQYHCIDKYEHYYLNEWMNDIMTSYFMEKLFNQSFHYDEMDKLKQYIDIDIQQLLSWYFGGHVVEIRHMLGDYDKLYQQIRIL